MHLEASKMQKGHLPMLFTLFWFQKYNFPPLMNMQKIYVLRSPTRLMPASSGRFCQYDFGDYFEYFIISFRQLYLIIKLFKKAVHVFL